MESRIFYISSSLFSTVRKTTSMKKYLDDIQLPHREGLSGKNVSLKISIQPVLSKIFIDFQIFFFEFLLCLLNIYDIV